MNKKSLFNQYLQNLNEVAARGDAREESFYSSLRELFENVAQATRHSHVHVTTLPKSTEAGNPDFRLWNGTDRIIGYIEAKNPTEEHLDQIEESEQLRRYRDIFPNLILTNFVEFRLYRNGERVDQVVGARSFLLNQLRTAPPVEKPDDLWALLERFLDFSLPQSYTAEELAVGLAKRTRFLRDDVVGQQLAEEQAGTPGALTGFYEAFQKFLIGHLTPEGFADLYAQTITYGLFAARTRAGDGFNRRTAFENIPHTIGVLRDLFRYISLQELPGQLEWIVDDISEVLASTDAPGILDRYYHQGKGSDPIVHFYETFLAEYDPAERERRGVYYTPEAVVSYIVRSLHNLLQSEFGKSDGLASEGVTLLDPAAGTMTFVARAAQEAVHEFEARYGSGGREQFIQKHILQNYYAFELMMAPYAVGHLKMAFFLEELGYRLTENERALFYLTNTLDMEELEQSSLPGLSSLAEESRYAGEVKKQKSILVVLGNPPYSGISTNMGKWITGLIEDYKYVDGKHFGEKKHWLQDDYVKFLRFAQWKIEQAGCGVVGMITNHSYLDNPTFRGMRQSLMQTFDEIYVLDLHGNSLKREVCPDGSSDENVFDIRQGVAIAFYFKRGSGKEKSTVVRHAEQWGLRQQKNDWLSQHDLYSTEWQEIVPSTPYYLFVRYDKVSTEEFQRFVPVTDVFPIYVTGIVTARDRFVFDFDRNSLLRRIGQFMNLQLEDDFIRKGYSLKDTRGWKLNEQRRVLAAMSDWQEHVVKCLYRPFDVRWLYYHPAMVDWGRPEVMRHMLAGENLALVTARSNKSPDMDHFFCSEHIVETKCGESTVQSYTFPLYRYLDAEQRDLFNQHAPSERQPNLNPKLLDVLTQAYGTEPSPEQIFHYIYAVVYAESYRDKFADSLKRGFPQIPFTTNIDLFHELVALGQRLVGLHLLKSPELDPPLARFHGEGDYRVAKTKGQGFLYKPEEECVYINKTQYFAPVPLPVWEYQIGGYQVCEKWLKDRKERRLELEDIRTYCHIVTALKRTIEIQEEIDALYPQVEAELLDIKL